MHRSVICCVLLLVCLASSTTLHGHPVGIDINFKVECVAVVNSKNEVEIVQDKHHFGTPAAYMAFKPNGNVLYGLDAQSGVNLDDTIVYDVKLMIARSFTDPSITRAAKSWFFSIQEATGDKIKVVTNSHTGSKPYTPEQLYAMLLQHTMNYTNAYLQSNTAANSGVVAVPAFFNAAQLAVVKHAAHESNFNVLHFIEQSVAAVYAYELDKHYSGKDVNIMVVTLDSGSFELAIVEIYSGTIGVLDTHTDFAISGDVIVNHMVNFCLSDFKLKKKLDASKSIRAVQRLRAACELALVKLYSSSSVDIELDSFFESSDLKTTITVNRVAEVAAPLTADILTAINNMLKTTALAKNNINEIVLVGGNTRIPSFQKKIVDHFNGKALMKSLNPEEVVARGAAIYAAHHYQ